jgi:hypothetical protein
VLVSIPYGRFGELPSAALTGKVVVDTGNYYPSRDGRFAELDSGGAASTGLVQRHLAGAQVVKGFNNIFYRHLAEPARPAGAPDGHAPHRRHRGGGRGGAHRLHVGALRLPRERGPGHLVPCRAAPARR